MSRSHKKYHRRVLSPLDKLVHLLAEIEVAIYLKEIKEEEQSTENAENESSDLRTL